MFRAHIVPIVGDLEKICDYITFIHGGGLVFSENKDELLEKYAVINADDGKLAELDENAVVAVRKNSGLPNGACFQRQHTEGV